MSDAAAAFVREVARRRLHQRVPRRRRMPRQQYPKGVEQAYAAELLAQLEQLHRRVKERIYPFLPTLAAEGQRLARRDDPRDVNKAAAALRLELTTRAEELAPRVRVIGQRTSQAVDEQLGGQLEAVLGVKVPIGDPAFGQRLQAFTAENVALIKSVEAQYLGDVEVAITRGVADGRRWEDIAGDLEARFGVSQSRAALIARDQVGKFYGALQEVRQTTLGIDGYFWETAGDERVREEHQVLQGKRFTWAQGAGEEGHPGEAINCRCTASPDLSALLAGL